VPPVFDVKVLVGILYTGENEWEECQQSIAQQTLAPVEQLTIAWLPNEQAHQLLYQSFESKKDEVDYFVKIDADMVLRKSTFFEGVVDLFNRQPSVDHLEIPVFDHFLEREILGLNCFRSTVSRKSGKNSIFTDACFIGKEKYRDWEILAPAADHCPDPSPFQSYHYGVHKAVKFHQESRSHWNARRAQVNWDRFQILLRNWRQGKKQIHRLAILGFLDAIYFGWTSWDLDFNAPSVRERLERRGDLPSVAPLLSQSPLGSALLLPSRLRKKLFLEIAWKRSSRIRPQKIREQ